MSDDVQNARTFSVDEVLIENVIINKIKKLTNRRFASWSNKDNSIKIWKAEKPYSQEPLKVLEGHEEGVFTIYQLKDKEILVSSGLDKTIRFWDINLYQCTTIINDSMCTHNNSIFQYDGERILVGTTEKEIIVINIPNKKIEKRLKDDSISNVCSFIRLSNGTILFGDSSGKIGKINFKNYSLQIVKDIMVCFIPCEGYEEPPNDYVNCLVNLDDDKFLTGSSFTCLKIFKY